MKFHILIYWAPLAYALCNWDNGIWEPEEGQEFSIVMRELGVTRPEIEVLNPAVDIDDIYPHVPYNVPYRVPRFSGAWTNDCPPLLEIQRAPDSATTSTIDRLVSTAFPSTSQDPESRRLSTTIVKDKEKTKTEAGPSYASQLPSGLGSSLSRQPTPTAIDSAPHNSMRESVSESEVRPDPTGNPTPKSSDGSIDESGVAFTTRPTTQASSQARGSLPTGGTAGSSPAPASDDVEASGTSTIETRETTAPVSNRSQGSTGLPARVSATDGEGSAATSTASTETSAHVGTSTRSDHSSVADPPAATLKSWQEKTTSTSSISTSGTTSIKYSKKTETPATSLMTSASISGETTLNTAPPTTSASKESEGTSDQSMDHSCDGSTAKHATASSGAASNTDTVETATYSATSATTSTTVPVTFATQKPTGRETSTAEPAASSNLASKLDTTNVGSGTQTRMTSLVSSVVKTTAASSTAPYTQYTTKASTTFSTDTKTTLMTSALTRGQTKTITTTSAAQTSLSDSVCYGDNVLAGNVKVYDTRVSMTAEAWCGRTMTKGLMKAGDQCLLSLEKDPWGLEYEYSICWTKDCVGDPQEMRSPLGSQGPSCATVFYQTIWTQCKDFNDGAGGLFRAGCLEYRIRAGVTGVGKV